MDLRCKDAHMRGRSVLVNGTSYKIGSDGVAEGVGDADAAKLLSMNGWATADGSEPPAPKPKPKPQEPPKPSKKAPPDLKPQIGQPEAPQELADDPWPPVAEGEETEEAEEPVPSMDMKKSELQGLADQYKVLYKATTTKQKLVELLEEAMFEEED